MGWFSTNRKPFSREFCERLDRLEAAINRGSNDLAEAARPVEVIPAEIVSSTTRDGEELFAWREITIEPNDDGGRSSDGYDAAGAADIYAFAAKAPVSGESFVVRHWVATSQDDGQGGTYPLHEPRYTIVGGAVVSTDNGFWALINGSLNFGTTARWKYAWQETTPDGAGGWMVPDGDPRSGNTTVGYALNTLESANTGSRAYGIDIAAQTCNGASTGRYIIHGTDGDFEFKPVPGGSVVWMRIHTFGDGTTQALFQAPNPIDGECDNPLAECPPP